MLRSEIQEKAEIGVYRIPGSVLASAVRERSKPGVDKPNPGWFQLCDAIELDESGYIVRIGGKMLDPSKIYRVGSADDLPGRASGQILADYFEAHPDALPEKDAGIPSHALLVKHW